MTHSYAIRFSESKSEESSDGDSNSAKKPNTWLVDMRCLTAAGITAQTLTPPTLTPKIPAELAEGAGIIRNRQAAIALGKALFWDQQAGSDNTACASCHYNAGADTRITNALNPGFNDVTVNKDGSANASGNANASGDFTFGSNRSDTGGVMPGHMLSGANADSNYTLKPSDFPMHKLSDETDANSALISSTNDRVGSQGTFDGIFDLVRRFGRKDRCSGYDAEVFHAGMFPARQVTARNSPSVINAVFNHRQFWDGRANNMFNGVGVFGMRDITGDANKRLIIADRRGRVELGYLTIPDASLASQALAPVVSAIEMSCDGRTIADVGKKMLETWPLERQTVDPSDSVLGRYASRWGKGLQPQYTYAALIRAAFDSKYWAADGRFVIVNGQLKRGSRGYTQMETPPYFSYGGYATLRQVMKSYNHGLNSRKISGINSPDAHGSWCTTGDDSGTGPDGNQNWPLPGPDCGTNIPGILAPLHLLDCDANGKTNPACVAEGKNTANDDIAALVRFMLALTDRRVQCDAAPFDHPELKVIERQQPTDRNINGRADDVTATLPAVGASGYKAKSGFCIPNSGDLFAPGMQARSGGTRVPLN